MTPFEILNNFMGFGCPRGRYWFIGIEEGSPWDLNSPGDWQKLADCKKAGKFLPSTQDDDLAQPIYPVISKIVSGFVGGSADSIANWETYRKDELFQCGSETCQCNLYPLGKQQAWPDNYLRDFGYGPSPEDQATYEQHVRATRFGALRAAWERYAPKVTICFGRKREDFKTLLDIPLTSAGEPIAGPYKEIFGEAYDHARVIMTPHFARGHMGDDRIRAVVKYAVDKGWCK
jgi:hypothetical protein